jgi:hypothetical protein
MGIRTEKSRVIKAAVWMILYLVIIDVFINILLPYPNDPLNINPSVLRRYFEYGRSIEGKLNRMTRHTDAESAPIVGSGWIDGNKILQVQNNYFKKEKTLVAVYGMSHMHLLGKAISALDNSYEIRDVTAPGAPANWSFAAYQSDKEHYTADVAILGIMTDGVPLLSTTSGTTMFFDMSYPYTYPRYVVEGNKLIPSYPPFMSVDGYREYFYDSVKWQQYRQWLSKHDKFFDSFLFCKTALDRSSLVRLIRRAYAEVDRKAKIAKVYTKDGFDEKCEEAIVLKRIVVEFAESARARNCIPVIYIVNNPGRGDHLFRMLKPTLDKKNIAYLSTHIICPPDNPSLFLAENNHFITEKNIELSQEMIKIIEIERNKK